MVSEAGEDPLDDLQGIARNVLLLVSLIAVTLMVNNFIEKWRIPIPSAITTVLIGIVAGGFASLSHGKGSLVALEDTSAREFMVLFLAPLIFAEGYGLKSRQFFDNLTRILTHALLGTLLSSIVVAAGLFYLAPLVGMSASEKLNLAECLTFGALISATDPVTTLAIFKEQQMVENGLSYLYYTVLGESILNDAVALTLFDSFGILVKKDLSIDAGSVLSITARFFMTFLGSMLIGFFSGILTALILKFARLGAGAREEEHFYFNVPEIGVVFVLAYLPFLVAEAANLSGVVAIMFAGICMRHYAHYNMTLVTRQVFLPTIELIANLCETYVFLLLGLGVFSLKNSYSLPLILWTMVLCAFARALHVYPFSWAVNRCSAARRLNRSEQHVLWYAGLRGAVAFICALGFPESADSSGKARHRNLILCTTVVLVFTSMLLLGWPTSTVLRLLSIGPRDDSRVIQDHLFEAGLETSTTTSRRGLSPSWLCSRMACAHTGLKQLLMTSDALVEREAVADMVSQRNSHISSHARPSNGMARPSNGMSQGALAAHFGPTMGNMPVSGNTPNASALAARYSGAAFAPTGLLHLFQHGRPSAPAGHMRDQVQGGSAITGGSGRPSVAAPRVSAPPLLVGTSDIGSRSTRMLCNP